MHQRNLPMKKLISVLGLLPVCFFPTSHAQEVGRVISSVPIIQQVAVPRQVCTQQQVTSQPSKSGAGALMGAIAGGTVGHAIGRDGLGTAIGIFGGAILGDKIEGSPPPEVKTVQTCSTPTVRLQITPVVSNSPNYTYPPLPAASAVPPPGSAPLSW